MKKSIFYFLSSFTFIVVLTPLAVLAAPNPAPINTILTNVLNLLTLLIQILIVSAIAVFGWGVVRLMFNANNPQKVAQAKQIIFFGLIGLFVLTSMYGIIFFIKTYLGVPDNTPIEAPKFTYVYASFLG